MACVFFIGNEAGLCARLELDYVCDLRDILLTIRDGSQTTVVNFTNPSKTRSM
jgi:hypothetical protein